MWGRQDSNRNVLLSEGVNQSPPLTYEECPSCHSRVQPGRFCASCGQPLSNQGGVPQGLLNDSGSNNSFGMGNDDFWVGSHNNGLRGMNDGGQATNSLLPSFSHSLTHRRFSSDFDNGDSLFNPPVNGDLLHNGIPLSGGNNMVSSGLLSHPSRRRAMTSSAVGDDFLFGEMYDNDPFEPSQEPLFQAGRTGSISLDPIESFGSPYGTRSSADVPLHTSNPMLSIPLFPYDNVPSSLDYAGDGMDPIYVGRSLSDVNSSTFDNYDFHNSSLFKYSPSVGSNHSSIMRRNSTGMPFNSKVDDIFTNQEAMHLPQEHSSVVKGTINFPASRAPRSISQTSPLSSGMEGQSLSPVSLTSQHDNSPVHSGLLSEKELNPPSKTGARRNSLSMPSMYKGRVLEISETKKLNEFNSFCNHIVELVCTQNGSKSLQTFLNSAMSETVREIVIDRILQEIESTGSKVICDTFGNYFYQLLFKKANSAQKEKLLTAMLYPSGEEGSTIHEISINKTGTFAFQNIIDYMSGEEVLGQLVMQSLQSSRLNGHAQNVILQLIKENKGTHIIQRIMKTFSISLWQPIYTILLENCFTIAMDRNGSMVLRLCYDLVDLTMKERIAKDIIQHALQLAVDPVGNYVVQHILSIPEQAKAEEVETYKSLIRGVLDVLSGHYIELSKQKYSSNVVEKSIVNSAQLGDQAIYKELLDIQAIMQLLENHFGIYVLQKTLQSLSMDELKEVDAAFRGSRLVNTNHGMTLLNKWRSIVNKVA